MSVAFQFAEGRLFNLSYAFTGDSKMLSNFFEGVFGVCLQGKTVLDDVLFFVGKDDQQVLHQFVQLDVLRGKLAIEGKIGVNHFDRGLGLDEGFDVFLRLLALILRQFQNL